MSNYFFNIRECNNDLNCLVLMELAVLLYFHRVNLISKLMNINDSGILNGLLTNYVNN